MPNPESYTSSGEGPNPQNIAKSIGADNMGRYLREQLLLAQAKGEKLVEDYREQVARTFLSAGIQLIPSDYLADHQYVVSRGVYEAAKKLAKTV